MSAMKLGSINVTALINAAKAGHPAFKRGKTNPENIWADIVMWINDEKDDRGYDSSILLNPPKEKRAGTKKVYIANLKSLDRPGVDEQVEIPEGQNVLTETAVNVLDNLPF